MKTDWTNQYPSARSTVLGHSIVSTSQPLAAQAGIRMLLEGGNAVDAAIATAMALTIVEPTGCGIGSDAFAIVSTPNNELHGLNGSGCSPAAWSPQRFQGMTEVPQKGWDSVTVPGAVSAWVALSKRFGKLPFPRLAVPAIEYARNGFPISPFIAHLWQLGGKRLGDQPGFAECFLPGGRAPKVGEIFRSDAHARTLEEIADTEGEAFYRGKLAEKIAAHSKACAGVLTAEDLAKHQPYWSGTISHTFANSLVHEIPPNGQGIAALIALGILEEYGVGDKPVDHVDTIHACIEAMKLALADIHQHNADIEHMRVTPESMLDRGYLIERAKLIKPYQASNPQHGQPQQNSTVYIATADASGMMVSFIQSNYMGFGSGIVVPDTGISLQNRGYGFTLQPGHVNEVAGNKRPSHSIIPAFATRQDQSPLMAFGVMGGPMQSQGHVQLAVRALKYGQNPQAAIDAPRWRVMSGLQVAVEPSFDPMVIAELKNRGHQINIESGGQLFAFGGAQLIKRNDDNNAYMAGSDPRKDGQAIPL